jgi:Fe-S-cluster containining protein
MAAFVCTRCGKCCAALGRHIRIERRVGSRDFYCRLDIGNEHFPARVDRDYEAIFREGLKSQEDRRNSCPFLRKNPDGEGFICTIYASRPRICREFRCYRMLIRDRDGNEIGRVKGRRDLGTTDDPLRKIWDDEIKPISASDDNMWLKLVSAALVKAGYLTEICD